MQKLQSISAYQNLEQLNIILFWKIAEKQDYKLLDIDYSLQKEYSELDLIDLEIQWLKLYDEYFSVKDSARGKSTLHKNETATKEAFKIEFLKDRLLTLLKLADNQSMIRTEDFSEILLKIYKSINDVEPKARVKTNDSIKFNAERLSRVIQSLLNRYELTIKREKQEQKKEVRNFYDSIAMAERVLERSFGDIDKINVLRWLAYEKQVETIINQKLADERRKPRN